MAKTRSISSHPKVPETLAVPTEITDTNSVQQSTSSASTEKTNRLFVQLLTDDPNCLLMFPNIPNSIGIDEKELRERNAKRIEYNNVNYFSNTTNSQDVIDHMRNVYDIKCVTVNNNGKSFVFPWEVFDKTRNDPKYYALMQEAYQMAQQNLKNFKVEDFLKLGDEVTHYTDFDFETLSSTVKKANFYNAIDWSNAAVMLSSKNMCTLIDTLIERLKGAQTLQKAIQNTTDEMQRYEEKHNIGLVNINDILDEIQKSLNASQSAN